MLAGFSCSFRQSKVEELQHAALASRRGGGVNTSTRRIAEELRSTSSTCLAVPEKTLLQIAASSQISVQSAFART